jgi:Leucine-rich repeat (LRR) protein
LKRLDHNNDSTFDIGALPSIIGLKSLKVFMASSNHLVESISYQWLTLPTLQLLNLQSNSFTNIDISEGFSSSLSFLDVSHNYLNNSISYLDKFPPTFILDDNPSLTGYLRWTPNSKPSQSNYQAEFR